MIGSEAGGRDTCWEAVANNSGDRGRTVAWAGREWVMREASGLREIEEEERHEVIGKRNHVQEREGSLVIPLSG